MIIEGIKLAAGVVIGIYAGTVAVGVGAILLSAVASIF